MIYITTIFFIFFVSGIKSDKKQNFFIFLLLLLLSSFRKNIVGTDLPTYIDIFKKASILNFTDYLHTDMEKGYLIFNQLISYISIHERWFIFITSITIMSMISYFILKQSKMIWLSYFLFITLGYYFMTFNTLRQCIAMGILLCSLKKIEERKFFYFLSYYFIAILFHYTSCLFILLYFIYPVSINRKFIVTTFISSVLVVLFSKKVVLFLINKIPKYRFYIDIIHSGEGLKLYFLYLFLFFVLYIFGKNTLKKQKILYQMFAIALVLQGLSFYFSVAARLTNYFSISLIILIPNIIFIQKDKRMRAIYLLFLYLFSMTYFIFLLRMDLTDSWPFLFYFE